MGCDHPKEHRYTFTEDDYWGSAETIARFEEAPNQNWDHGICLACGAVLWICDHCEAGFISLGQRSPRGRWNDGEPIMCNECLRCVKCCTVGDVLQPLAPEDRRYAIAHFIAGGRHHYLKDAKGNPLYALNSFGGADSTKGNATRYSIEDRIVEAATEAEAVRLLTTEDNSGGSGPCDDVDDVTHYSVSWHGRAWKDHDTVAHAVPGKQKPTKRPAGLYVELDHRRGVIDPLAVVRFIRAQPRRSYVHMGCGGIFTTAFHDGRCHFWLCNGDDRDAPCIPLDEVEIDAATTAPRVEDKPRFDPPPVAIAAPSKRGQLALF